MKDEGYMKDVLHIRIYEEHGLNVVIKYLIMLKNKIKATPFDLNKA